MSATTRVSSRRDGQRQSSSKANSVSSSITPMPTWRLPIHRPLPSLTMGSVKMIGPALGHIPSADTRAIPHRYPCTPCDSVLCSQLHQLTYGIIEEYPIYVCLFMHCTAGLISAIVSRTLLCRKHTTVRFMRLCIKKSDNREPGMLMIALGASLHRRPMHILFLDYFESRVHEISKWKKYVPTYCFFPQYTGSTG